MTTFSKRLRAFAVAAAAATVVLPVLAGADEPELHLLFVQGARSMQADADAMTLRLVGVAEQTIYFSDRPARVAGIVETKNFVGHWGTGEDSFATNPPNATLTVYDAEAEKNTAAVLVLNDPVLEGSDLVYSYELLAGTVPQEGGAAGLFIDTFGPGGGVGASYHGVGVGARGPGAAGWAGVAVRNCAVDEDC